jgi:hypothetical protein
MRRYGEKQKTTRKWKKISKMSENELIDFKNHLENNNQVNSKVYAHVINAMS